MIAVTIPFLGARLPLEAPAMPYKPSGWLGHEPFAFWLMDALRPRSYVELGVHFGTSYCAFCEAVASLGLETRCTGIDSWQGDEHAGLYDGRRVLQDLAAYHDPLYSGFSRLLQSDFDGAAASIAPGSVDLLHIDGFHSYEAVRHDYETWKHTLSDRAVVLFHDTTVFERDFGVHQFWAEISAGRPHFSFAHGHGLGVLGHGTALPEPMRLLFGAGEEEAERIRRVFASLGDRATRERVALTAPPRRLPEEPAPWRLWLGRHMPAPVKTALRRVVG